MRPWVIAVLIAVVAASGPACAQQSGGTLTGTITDGTNSVVSSAAVTLTRINSGDTRTTRTNSAGYFTFAFVPAGEYALAVDATGFARWTRSGIVIGPETSGIQDQLFFRSPDGQNRSMSRRNRI
jgi:hypothetical protein